VCECGIDSMVNGGLVGMKTGTEVLMRVSVSVWD
jgi:hypothetical protein